MTELSLSIWTKAARQERFAEAAKRVTTRAIGSIPHCKPAQPSFRPFDSYAYWSSVNAYCREIQRAIRHMDQVRAGLAPKPEIAA